MRLKHVLRGTIFAASLLLAGSAARADGITINNNSFESYNPLPYTCIAPVTCSWNGGPIPGWDSPDSLNQYGSYQPGTSTYASLPDGSTIAWLNLGSISQTLTGVTLQPNETYLLSAYVGHRLPDATVFYAGDPQTDLIADYTISLYAGTTQLASLTGSNGDITAGTFTDEVLTYTTGDVVTSGDLTIVLATDGAQIDFDDVTLTDPPAPTPEPGSRILMTIGLSCLVGLWRIKA